MSFPRFVGTARNAILSDAIALTSSDAIPATHSQLANALDCLVRIVGCTFRDGASESSDDDLLLAADPTPLSELLHVDSNSLDLVVTAALRGYASTAREHSGMRQVDGLEEQFLEGLQLPTIAFELLCRLQLPLVSRTSEMTRSSITRARRFNSSRPPPPEPNEKAEAGASCVPDALLGSGEAVRRIRATFAQLARRSRAPVLLIGEAGTGKRLYAQLLHRETYADGELFEIARVDQVVDLKRRIATFRARNANLDGSGLTLYASNVAELPASLQADLVNWLDQRDLQMRLVASVTQPMAAKIITPLLAQLATHIELPPLRQRIEDLSELFDHFAQRAARERGERPIVLSPPALKALQEHGWPGNVTELFALVARLTQTTASGEVEAAQLAGLLRDEPALRLPRAGINLSEVERNLLQQAMFITGNNQTRAADLLGLTRDQLRYRLAKFELSSIAIKTG